MSKEQPELLIRTDGPDAAEHTVLLAHGAGSPMDSPAMNAFADALAHATVRVGRFEFPYMRQRRITGKLRGPDSPAVLQRTWLEMIDAFGDGNQMVIGGKSMGGRIASMIADEACVRGLVCLGYPFHPPGRPEVLRTAHLVELATPALILQGTRDAFGNLQEIPDYALSSSIRVEWVEDGDHSFMPRVRSGRTFSQNIEFAVGRILAFLATLR